MKKILVAIVAALAAFGSPAMASFVPHAAVYDIKLKKLARSSQVQAISGTLAYSLQDQCDVWIIESDMAMFIAWAEVGRNTRRTMLLSEAKDDSLGTFVLTNVDQMRDARRGTVPVREVVEGRLELPPGQAPRLTLKGEVEERDAPAGTLLTTRHLMEMVKAAQDGRNFVTHTVLDPSLDEQIARVTGFVLGPAEDDRLRGQGQAWAMRLAYFSLDQADVAPNYELEITVSETGIVSSFVQDLGELQIAGELQSLEVSEVMGCQ